MIQLDTTNGHNQQVVDAFNKISKKFSNDLLLHIILTNFCDDSEIEGITDKLNEFFDENRPDVVLNIGDSVAIKYNGEDGFINAQLGKETNDPNEETWYEVITNVDQIEHVKESDLIPDMFEHIKSLPIEVQAVLERYSTEDETYENLSNMRIELGALGYEFEYDLNAVPYMLREKNLVVMK